VRLVNFAAWTGVICIRTKSTSKCGSVEFIIRMLPSFGLGEDLLLLSISNYILDIKVNVPSLSISTRNASPQFTCHIKGLKHCI